MTPVRPLTRQQRAILDFLAAFLASHGYAPTLAEIGEQFNLSAMATVHKHLHNLRKAGYIRRQHGKARAIELVMVGNVCPTCGSARVASDTGTPTQE